MKRFAHRMVIVTLTAIGTVIFSQYGVSSVEKTGAAHAVETQTGGEWLEFVNGAVIVSAADSSQNRPSAFPYFYLSKNWDACVEFTHDAPQGRVCTTVFDNLLKDAETFVTKDAV